MVEHSNSSSDSSGDIVQLRPLRPDRQALALSEARSVDLQDHAYAAGVEVRRPDYERPEILTEVGGGGKGGV